MADNILSGVSEYTSVEIADRAERIEGFGLLGRPATPPSVRPLKGACAGCGIVPGASILAGRLDAEGHCDSCAIQAIRESAKGPRLARTLECLRAVSLADRCRTASAILEAAAGDASSVEPGTLRRRVDGIVRSLIAELNGQVTT